MTKSGEEENKEQDERRKRDTVRDGSLLSRWINYADQITEKKEVGALGEDVNRERQRGQRENESRWRSGGEGTNVTAEGSEWPIREQAIS